MLFITSISALPSVDGTWNEGRTSLNVSIFVTTVWVMVTFQIPVQARNCVECGLKHHTLIHHQQQQQQQQSAQKTAPTVEQTPTPDPTRVLRVEGRPTTSLMETAVLKVTAGRTETVARALLDGGASLSLVTSRFATLLGAKISSHMNIKGVGGSLDTSHAVELELSSAYDREGESVTIHCQVVDHITDVPVQRILEVLYKPQSFQSSLAGRL